MKRYLFILLVFCCSCATHYATMGFRGGYSDLKIDSDIYEVRVAGNGYTSQGLIEKYFLLRCSEIAIENGKNYFIFYDKNIESEKTNTNVRGNIDSYGNIQASTWDVVKTSGKGTIKILESRPENYNGLVYDAREIFNNLNASVNRGKNKIF